MSFWSKLRRLALACCIALLAAVVAAALLEDDASENVERIGRSHTFVEN